MSARILKGDVVLVTQGREKGKQGKIITISREHEKVTVEGVNVRKRHLKPTQKNPQGGVVEREQAIHISNVMHIDPKSGKPTRIRMQTLENGKKVRVAVKSGEQIPTPAHSKA